MFPMRLFRHRSRWRCCVARWRSSSVSPTVSNRHLKGDVKKRWFVCLISSPVSKSRRFIPKVMSRNVVISVSGLHRFLRVSMSHPKGDVKKRSFICLRSSPVPESRRFITRVTSRNVGVSVGGLHRFPIVSKSQPVGDLWEASVYLFEVWVDFLGFWICFLCVWSEKSLAVVLIWYSSKPLFCLHSSLLCPLSLEIDMKPPSFVLWLYREHSHLHVGYWRHVSANICLCCLCVAMR